jgi:hypothetical protein
MRKNTKRHLRGLSLFLRDRTHREEHPFEEVFMLNDAGRRNSLNSQLALNEQVSFIR